MPTKRKTPEKVRIDIDVRVSPETAGALDQLKLLKGIKKGHAIEISMDLLAREIKIKGLDGLLSEISERPKGKT